jgi:hypothetical protein
VRPVLTAEPGGDARLSTGDGLLPKSLTGAGSRAMVPDYASGRTCRGRAGLVTH